MSGMRQSRLWKSTDCVVVASRFRTRRSKVSLLSRETQSPELDLHYACLLHLPRGTMLTLHVHVRQLSHSTDASVQVAAVSLHRVFSRCANCHGHTSALPLHLRRRRWSSLVGATKCTIDHMGPTVQQFDSNVMFTLTTLNSHRRQQCVHVCTPQHRHRVKIVRLPPR